MRYIQFYQLSTGYVPGSIPPRFDEAHRKPIEATGDRSVVIVDGRVSAESVARIAEEEGVRRGYVGYRIHKGESFTRSSPISGYWPLPHKVDKTASSATHGA